MPKFQNQDLAIRMKAATGRGLCFLDWICGSEVRDLGDEPGRRERFFDEVAFQVDIGIYFMCEAIVAVVFLKADVVRCSANP